MQLSQVFLVGNVQKILYLFPGTHRFKYRNHMENTGAMSRANTGETGEWIRLPEGADLRMEPVFPLNRSIEKSEGLR